MVIMAGGYARGRVRTANLVTSVRDPFDKHQEIKTSGRNGKMSQHYFNGYSLFACSETAVELEGIRRIKPKPGFSGSDF